MKKKKVPSPTIQSYDQHIPTTLQHSTYGWHSTTRVNPAEPRFSASRAIQLSRLLAPSHSSESQAHTSHDDGNTELEINEELVEWVAVTASWKPASRKEI